MFSTFALGFKFMRLSFTMSGVIKQFDYYVIHVYTKLTKLRILLYLRVTIFSSVKARTYGGISPRLL